MMDPGRMRANVEGVRRRIDAAAKRAGRDPGEVTLVAVTKSVSVRDIENLASCGVREAGESRAIEGGDRIRQVQATLRWHMIGHLQTNKVKKALEWAEVLHSVDRLALAEELQKHLLRNNRNLPVFVQVNISGEASKGGFRPEEVPEAILDLRRRAPRLRIEGLMTMAPEAGDVRPYFRGLRDLAAKCGLRGSSMGMSRDFEVAVEEGATVVRVGSALFEGAETREPSGG